MTTNTNIQLSQWYAVQTLTNKESKVKQFIEKFAVIENMVDYIEEVLVPSEKVSEVKNGKKITRDRKFYPGYVFIKMKLFDESKKLMQKPWSFIKGIEGVVNFIGGDRPVALKKDEIEGILNKVKESEGKEIPKIQYEVGQVVKIMDGPFLNLTGEIEEIDIERGKLKVLVSLFGRSTPVELEAWQVQRVTE